MLEYDKIHVSETIMFTKPMVCASVLFVITGSFLKQIFDFSQ